MNTKTESDMGKWPKRARAILDILNGLTTEEHQLIILNVIVTAYANLKLSGDKEHAEFYLESFLIGIKTLYEKKDYIKVNFKNESIDIVIEDLINERNEK